MTLKQIQKFGSTNRQENTTLDLFKPEAQNRLDPSEIKTQNTIKQPVLRQMIQIVTFIMIKEVTVQFRETRIFEYHSQNHIALLSDLLMEP